MDNSKARSMIDVTALGEWLDEMVRDGYMSRDEAFKDLLCWLRGVKFPSAYTTLDGFICRYGQDHGMSLDQIAAVRSDVFQPKGVPSLGA